QRRTAPMTLLTPLAGVSDFVVSVSDRHFVIADEHGERTRQKGKRPRSTAGMSGAPVFIASGNRLPEWAGILYEGIDMSGPLFATHSDVISRDGHIDGGRV